jgi:hypothetical protein
MAEFRTQPDPDATISVGEIRQRLLNAQGKGDQGAWDVVNWLHDQVIWPDDTVTVWYSVPVAVTVDCGQRRVTEIVVCDEQVKIDYDREGGTITDENGLKLRAAERAWGVAIDIAECTDPVSSNHGWPAWEFGF